MKSTRSRSYPEYFMGMGRPRPVLLGYRGEGAPAPNYRSLFFVFTGSVKFPGYELGFLAVEGRRRTAVVGRETDKEMRSA
jgi:hypothetical protein